MNDHLGVADRKRSGEENFGEQARSLTQCQLPRRSAGSATEMPLIVSPDQFGAAGPGDFPEGGESREARAPFDLEVIR